MSYDEFAANLHARVARGGQFFRNLDAALANVAQGGASQQGQYGNGPGTTPTSFDLQETATVVLDGSGNGTARISPGQPGGPGSGVGAGRNSGLLWNVTGISVNVATNVLEASAKTYVSYGIQSAGLADFQGQTQTASTGDTNTINATLRPGDWITVVWTGGDPGQAATLKVFGTVTPPGA
jgi:hypothetical protein